jgi:hypothetical protein
LERSEREREEVARKSREREGRGGGRVKENQRDRMTGN